MKKNLNDYLVEKDMTGKDYRKYEIQKFIKWLDIKKLETITFEQFQDYLKFRNQNISYSTIRKINSVISSFLFWVANNNKNFKLLTQLYTDKSFLNSARKKKEIRFIQK